MDLDWKSIAGAVAPFAPKLGTVLGSAFGPFGGLIGGLAGNAIAGAFGTAATPEAIGKAIAEDPKATEKLEALEAARGQEILAQAQVEIEKLKQQTAQFDIEARDRAGARSFLTDLSVAQSPLQWAAPTLGFTVVSAFFAVLALRLLRAPATPDQLLDGLTGTLGAAFMMVVSFFFGSTSSSRNKDATIQNMTAAAAAPAPAPIIIAPKKK